MKHASTLLTCMAVLALLLTSATSQAQSDDLGEQYHLFTSQGLTSPAKEKEMTELLRGFDNEMVVSIDRPTHQVKLVSTVDLDVAEVVDLCRGIGVQLNPLGRREYHAPVQ